MEQLRPNGNKLKSHTFSLHSRFKAKPFGKENPLGQGHNPERFPSDKRECNLLGEHYNRFHGDAQAEDRLTYYGDYLGLELVRFTPIVSREKG